MNYFIRKANGPEIKIGTARRLAQRLRQLVLDHGQPMEVLAVVEGSFEQERALHARFAHLRVEGEWFRPEPELLDYIASNGKPWEGDRLSASVAVTIKGSPEWQRWVEAGAKHCRTNVSACVDRALVKFFRSQGFKEPAPARLPKEAAR